MQKLATSTGSSAKKSEPAESAPKAKVQEAPSPQPAAPPKQSKEKPAKPEAEREAEAVEAAPEPSKPPQRPAPAAKPAPQPVEIAKKPAESKKVAEAPNAITAKAAVGAPMESPNGEQELAAPVRPAPKPVDHTVWLSAREIMDALIATQVQFQLADPEARFNAIRNKLRDKLVAIPSGKRELVTDQLKFLFPVVEGTTEFKFAAPQSPMLPDTDTPPAGSKLPKEKDGRQDLDKHDPDNLLRDVFQTHEMKVPAGFDETGEGTHTFVRLSQLFYRFALEIEQFTMGVLGAIGGGAMGDSQVFLPLQVNDLRRLVKRVKENDPKVVDAMAGYLNDMRNWQVSLITSYQKAIDKWNEDVWNKIKPETIRMESGVKPALQFMQKSTLWDTYEEKVRDLHPEVTSDELHQLLHSMTMQEFKRLSEQKKKTKDGE